MIHTRPYIALIRPSNFIITLASVIVSCILAGATRAAVAAVLAASLAASLIAAGGMVINDYFDVEIDRINKPKRPLPSGAVSRRAAVRLWVILSLFGLLLNVFLPLTAAVIAILAFVIIFYYSKVLKRTPLFGNLTVGVLTGLTFIYGGAVVGNINRAIMPAVFAFLINVGREIIKDMEDVKGDLQYNAATLPVRFGMRRSAVLATIFLSAVIASTVVPFVNREYGLTYFIIVNAGVNAVLVGVIASLWRNFTAGGEQNLRRLSSILKYDMLIGLIAIYLG
ncbi:MAG: geranylgeranylglycerol-phosphate geranylgeranyltransferase [Bacteroidota bacterium]|nr:geranylgeranylglycerol-phosphate geranylgeranyltransferase [Bacteroidota bacterium]